MRKLVLATLLCSAPAIAAPPPHQAYVVRLSVGNTSGAESVYSTVMGWMDETDTTVNSYGSWHPVSQSEPMPVAIVSGGSGGGGGGGTVTQGTPGTSAWPVSLSSLPAFAFTPTFNVGTLPSLPAGSALIGSVTDTATAALATAASGTGLQVKGSIAAAGSLGTDATANRPTLPNVGANFGSTGTYANYVLIATVAASTSRLAIEVSNTSGAQIVLIRDDGTAAAAAAPVNASVFALGGGSGVGSQGAGWSSQTFKGRLQVYAPVSTAFVNVMVD